MFSWVFFSCSITLLVSLSLLACPAEFVNCFSAYFFYYAWLAQSCLIFSCGFSYSNVRYGICMVDIVLQSRLHRNKQVKQNGINVIIRLTRMFSCSGGVHIRRWYFYVQNSFLFLSLRLSSVQNIHRNS